MVELESLCEFHCLMAPTPGSLLKAKVQSLVGTFEKILMLLLPEKRIEEE